MTEDGPEFEAATPDDIAAYLIPWKAEVPQDGPPLAYNPTPQSRRLFGEEPGVVQGYLVLHEGKAGPAKMWNAAVLVGPEGEWAVVSEEGGPTDITIIDDIEENL